MVKRLLFISFILFITLNGSAQLSGTYTVAPGGGGDFASLTEAAAALNASGMNSSVTLQLENGLYQEQVLFDIPGQTETQFLTIESASGNEGDVVFRYEDATEEENYQMAFVAIKALTVRNISIDTEDLENGRGIELKGICSNILIDNLNHHGNRNDEAIFGYGFVGFFDPAEPVINLTVSNSFFTECSPSISLGANLFTPPGEEVSENIVVTNNTFYDADGVEIGFSENITIEDNVAYGDIYNVQPIKLNTCSGNVSIRRNKIWNSFNAVEIASCMGTAENPILVANNFIAGFSNMVSLSFNTELSFVYNSVYGDDEENLVTTTENTDSRILNNIFYQNHPDGYIFNLFFDDQAQIDYNNLYSNGAYGILFDGSGLLELSYQEYRDETGNETNGTNVQPVFEIPGEDLHASNPALNAGTPIPSVPEDIDGELRNAVTPSIGADEIDGNSIVSDLTVEEITYSGDPQSGSELAVEWSGQNAGDLTFQAPWTDKIFLSDDAELDESDLELAVYESENDLLPGEEYVHQKLVTLPLSAFGEKYLIVEVDALADLNEDNQNNVTASAPFTIAPPPLPNLVVTQIDLPATVFSGTTVEITFSITNQGEVPASGNWSDYVWLVNELADFSEEEFEELNDPFGYASNIIGLMPGETYASTISSELPAVSQGWHYVLVETDGTNEIIEELDADDNFTDAIVDSFFVNQSPLADLVITEIQTPSETFAGEDITVSYTITNAGSAPTAPVELPFNYYFGYTWVPLLADWVDYTYLADSTLEFDPLDYEDVHSRLGNLPPDSSYIVVESITIPECISGPYYVIAFADRWNHVVELDDGNNGALSDSIQVLLRPSPDLIPSSNDPLENWSSNNTFSFFYRIENLGADTANISWKDKVFLSDSAEFQFDMDELVSTAIRDTLLAPDASLDLSIQVPVPPEVYGDKFLHIWVDAENDICEAPFDTNNIATFQLPIAQSPAADLSVSFLPPSGILTAGDELELDAIVLNEGEADPNESIWTDAVFLLGESSEADTVYIEKTIHSGGLIPDATYPIPDPFQLPLDLIPGTYTLGVMADRDLHVWENQSESNNASFSEPFEIELDSSRVADLLISSIQWDTSEVLLSGTQPVIGVNISNAASATGINTWVDDLSLLDTEGNVVASAHAVFSGLVESGDQYAVNFNLNLPAITPGSYELRARADTGSSVFEYAVSNNISSIAVTVEEGPLPDLSPTNLQIPEQVNAGQPLFFSVLRNNLGSAAGSGSSQVERILLSQDNIVDDNDPVLYSRTYDGDELPEGFTSVLSDSTVVPLGYTGTYFVLYVMDAGNNTGESDETNNVVSANAPLEIITPLPVDFQTNLISLATANGDIEYVHYSLTNTSNNDFDGRFYNAYFLSKDDTYSSNDQFFNREYVGNYSPGAIDFDLELGGGETAELFGSLRYLPVVEGSYYVIQKIDVFNNVYESNETNNTFVYGPLDLDNIEEIFSDVTYERQFGRNLPAPASNIYTDIDYDLTPDRHHYKIEIPDDFGMITRMWENEAANENYGISNESQPIYEIYIGEDFVPSPSNFDYRFNNPLQSDQTVLVPVDSQRTGYIKTTAPYIPPHFSPDSVPISQYRLRAEFKEYSIVSAKPQTIGNKHNVTLRIRGFDLSDSAGLEVGLVQGTDTTYAFETYPQNSSELVAYVDMRGKSPGEYELIVRKATSGAVAIWDEPITVIDDFGALWVSNVNAPGRARSGQDFTVQVTYGNDGYSNIYDMTFYVAFFNDDTTGTGIDVRFLGSNVETEEVGGGFIADESNPPGVVDYGDLGYAIVYAIRIPILHAQWSESLSFEVNAQRPGIITTQASFGILQRSPYTFTGRIEDAGTSHWAAVLSQSLASVSSLLDDYAGPKSGGACDVVLDADYMTARVADETYKVAEKARGAQGWGKDVKDAIKGVFGRESTAKERYDSYNDLVDKKGELDLTASDDTPFKNELEDVFNCIDPEYEQNPNTNSPCYEIATWTQDGVQYRVPVYTCGQGNNEVPPPYPPKPKSKDETENENSDDPNEIVGPSGQGPQRLVENEIEFLYTVYFENRPEANGPAIRVRIDNPLDSNLRIQTLRIRSFGFADTSFQFNDVPFLQQEIPLGAQYQNQILRVFGGTNPITGKAFFEFTALDPQTLAPAITPGSGFLFPNDSTGRGQGYVTYAIRALPGLDPGVEISNRADIIFDENEVIETNTWTNLISGGELASRVLELPTFSSPEFSLEWINETPPFGPLVDHFKIYVRQPADSSSWKLWLGNTKSLKKKFNGKPGHTYEFRSVAVSADGSETLGIESDAATTILDFRGDLSGGDPILFPNPASDHTTLVYKSPGADAAMQLRMSNIQGKVFRNFSFKATGDGIQYFPVPIADLSAGLYVLELYHNNDRLGTAKLVLAGARGD